MDIIISAKDTLPLISSFPQKTPLSFQHAYQNLLAMSSESLVEVDQKAVGYCQTEYILEVLIH